MITGRPPRDALERAAAMAATNRDPMETCLSAGAMRYSELLLEAVDAGLGIYPNQRPQEVLTWRQQFPPMMPEAPLPQVKNLLQGGDGNGQQSSYVPIEVMDTRRVLVVDDQPLVVNLMRRMLINLGMGEVHTAVDGSAALEVLARAEPPNNTAFCDLDMPGMDRAVCAWRWTTSARRAGPSPSCAASRSANSSCTAR